MLSPSPKQEQSACLSRPELPTVRVAQPSDEAEIMEMCRKLHAENGLFSFSEDKVRDYLHRCYNRKGAIIGVIGESGNIQASTCLLISEMYYTRDWHLAELWNHVLEQFRASRNAEGLIAFGKKCSEEIGIPFITGIITNTRTAAKVRLYRRILGYPAGAFFVYNGKWNNGNPPSEEDFWKPFETRVQLRKRVRRERRGQR